MGRFAVWAVFGWATIQGVGAHGVVGQGLAAKASPSQVMTGHPGEWGYEEGVLLDGMAAEWHATANGQDFAYIKAAVDKYVTDDGTIVGYKSHVLTLDDIEMGRAVLFVYRVTQQAAGEVSLQG
jgi:unsaturated rhamnogalacturonyl hydrolase